MKQPNTEESVKNLWKIKMAHLRMRWSCTNWDEAGERMLRDDLKQLKESKKIINIDQMSI